MAAAAGRRKQRGIALIWTVLVLFAIIGMVGLAIDWGYCLLVAHQLQNAADAAALAGAAKVRTGSLQARQAAMTVGGANKAAGEAVLLMDNPDNLEAGEIVIGRYRRPAGPFTPTLFAPNAVKVTTRRTQDSLNGSTRLLFGSVFGVNTVEMSREAIAMIGGGTGAGIIALDPTKKNAFSISGTVTVETGAGAIQVNSTHASGASANGTPNLITPALNVCGDARFVGGPNLTGELNPGAPPIPDPLANLPPPPYSIANDLGSIRMSASGEVRTIGPGYYSGGINLSGGSLTLQPGIYVLAGAGLNVSGNATFFGEGVMLYVIGTGVVDLTGTNTIHLTPPNPEVNSFPGADTYERISIFQARTDTNGSRIIGTSLLDLQGTLYFPKADLELGGTGDGFGNQLISNTIDIHGTGVMTIAYDGQEPASGFNVFLVE